MKQNSKRNMKSMCQWLQTLTPFIAYHREIFQNRDNNNGVNDRKLTLGFIADHSGIFQNRDNNNGKLTQMEIWNEIWIFEHTSSLKKSKEMFDSTHMYMRKCQFWKY